MAVEDTMIGGKYTHFKGNSYEVYCIALDKWNNRFVLYQQNYGDKSFWLRPYDMFFGETNHNGKLVKRFTPTSAKRKAAKTQISRLIAVLQTQTLEIKNSEDEQLYCITNIDETREYVCIHPLSNTQVSGYLTEYELAARMGYDLLLINNSMHIGKRKVKFAAPLQLHIGENNDSVLKNQLNPCSIDLQIADSGFLRAKKAVIDPQAIEHVSNATSLWKEVRLRQSRKLENKYFRLRPGQTVLTHTKERIRIPDDCAGKIEIKSTYARLSLNITSGDFCNPGYWGYFPLEITNLGKHTVIIHAGETMAQLMLIALPGPILVDYSQKATYKNEKGYDDGTPYTFWRERAIKTLRKNSGAQHLIEFYSHILSNIAYMSADDINAFRERFVDTFLPFCQRRMHKQTFQKNGIPDLDKLVYTYIKQEKRLQKLWSFKWVSVIGCTLGTTLGYIANTSLQVLLQHYLTTGTIPPFLKPFMDTKTPLLLGAGVFALVLIVSAIVFLKAPKVFCTFTKRDISEDLKCIRSKMP